jgi:hypothetical protein
MLNHLAKILCIFVVSLTLFACHKPAVLDKKLALNILITSHVLPGYTINIVTNNPHARREKASGWNCADKQAWVDAGVVNCKNSGRSGVYLKFTTEGKKLLVDDFWGNEVVRNAKVIAVSQHINDVSSIEMINNAHALINFTWIYDQHTAFSNAQLQKDILLNVPQTAQVPAILKNGEWTLKP